MGCHNSCFEDYLVKCVDEITVNGQLEPLSSYVWVIKDKAGRRYSAEFITDSTGFWTIPIADLPAGLLTEHSGTFALTVQDSDTCKPVKMKVAQEVDCISFEIFAGSYLKDNLGCSFICTGVSGAAPDIIDFEGETDLTVTYTPAMLAAHGNGPNISVYSLVSGTTYQLETAIPIQTIFTNDVLTSIVFGNLDGLTGYIIIN